MPKIIPCLLFNDRVDEALAFYRSVFEDSELLSKSAYGEAGPGEAIEVLTAWVS